MQWVAYDQVACGLSDAVVIRRVVISQHAKLKNFSRTKRHHHPTTIKSLHSRKIIKLGFLLLPYWFLTESSQYQSSKAKLFPALFGNYLGLLEFKICVSLIMLLKNKNKGILKHIPNIKLHYIPNIKLHYIPNIKLHYIPNIKLHYIINIKLHYIPNIKLHYIPNIKNSV